MLYLSLAQGCPKIGKKFAQYLQKVAKHSQSQEKSKYLDQTNFKALKYLQQTMIWISYLFGWKWKNLSSKN